MSKLSDWTIAAPLQSGDRLSWYCQFYVAEEGVPDSPDGPEIPGLAEPVSRNWTIFGFRHDGTCLADQDTLGPGETQQEHYEGRHAVCLACGYPDDEDTDGAQEVRRVWRKDGTLVSQSRCNGCCTWSERAIVPEHDGASFGVADDEWQVVP